jgi:DNA-binding GntR family transcriptional regulator
VTTHLGAQTIVDALAEAVRAQILTGEIPAGGRLTEQEIATLYDVARPTAKAAIERVVQMGILRRTANKPARVPLLSRDDIRDLYASRLFFERQVVSELAERGTATLAAENALAGLNTAFEQTSLLEAVGSDIAFHQALVDGMGSKRTSQMYQTLLGEAYLCIAQEQPIADQRKNIEEHGALLRAIHGKKVDLAVDLITVHLTSAAERLLNRPGQDDT